jgi:hypothetical protein
MATDDTESTSSSDEELSDLDYLKPPSWKQKRTPVQVIEIKTRGKNC